MKIIDILKSLDLKPGAILYSPLFGNVMFLKFKGNKIICLNNQGETDVVTCITMLFDVTESEVSDQIDAICEDSEYVLLLKDVDTYQINQIVLENHKSGNMLLYRIHDIRNRPLNYYT